MRRVWPAVVCVVVAAGLWLALRRAPARPSAPATAAAAADNGIAGPLPSYAVPGSDAPEAPPAVSLRGRVIDRASRRPIAAAHVAVYGRFTDEHVVTDADGRFAISGVEGAVHVRARTGRFLGEADAEIPAAAPVAAGAGASAPPAVEIVVECDTGLAVRGRVLDRDGHPVARAVFGVEERGAARLTFGSDDDDRPSSAADGSYELAPLRPGRYQISVVADGFAGGRATLVVDRDLEHDFVLDAFAKIRGSVVDAAGRPARDVRVLADATEWRSDAVTLTDSNGRFELPDVTPGTVTVRAGDSESGWAEAGPFTVAGGESREVTLTLAPGVIVSGRVTWSDGTPVEATEIGWHSQKNEGRAETDRDGRYRVSICDDGNGMIVVTASDPDDEQTVSRMVTVEPGARELHADFTLQKGGHRVAGVAVGPDGKPVPGARVHLDWLAHGQAARRFDLTDKNGRFEFDKLPRARISVRVSKEPYTTAMVEPVAVDTRDLRIQLGLAATLSGRVVDGRGRPVPDYSLRLDAEDLVESRTVAVHARDGAFRVEAVQPGAFVLTAEVAGSGRGALGPIVVAEGADRSGLTITVGGDAVVAGRVVDATTRVPIAGAHVLVGGDEYHDAADTADDGTFVIERVPAGALTLSISADDHVTDERPLVVRGGSDADAGEVALVAGAAHERITAYDGIDPVVRDGITLAGAVEPGSPAALAGIQAGDALLDVNGRDVRALGPNGVNYLLYGDAGQEVSVTYAPGGSGAPRTVSFRLIAVED
jgi:Carboxypeptidase regulatory-like domain/PDZ domain